MTIQIPQGKSYLYYTGTNVIQLSDYKDDIEIAFKLCPVGNVRVYIPSEPILTSFTTLNNSLSYEIVALRAFEINT